MRKTIAVCGTFDSKGEEFSYLAEQVRKLGADVLSGPIIPRRRSLPQPKTGTQAAVLRTVWTGCPQGPVVCLPVWLRRKR